MDARKIADLRKEVLEYDPNKNLSIEGYIPKKISIRVFGKLGHGKSTFINNCLCVVKDSDYENFTGEGPATGGAVNNRLEVHDLTSKVEIVDNRGLRNLNPREIHECNMQLDGVRKTQTQVCTTGWASWAWFLDIWKNRQEEWAETIHVPIFIYKADMPRITSEIDQLRQFIDNAYYYTGIYPIIVLMFAEKMAVSLDTFRGFFGNFHCTDTFPVNNYHEKETNRNTETDTAILEIIRKCLSRADGVIKRIRPEKVKPTSFD
ncbi:uncharacterized protein LOC103189731 [Callorhinchus milii]|uniref:Uncharacterized LOC103189731 n=1 Tax=Callorhinchus milii TaxID=7868 RepID=A0A4W3HBJ8_CALMI|nr:uncharacterized protein LOC103189731 [Callorhinchus milii]|eukprot:gi/632982987/ref/XP_007908425.1/ PREDICTED: uncharacterized protein LOC103189731 [Callorhinchus milii]